MFVNHIRDRWDKGLLPSDIRSIKDGLVDYCARNETDLTTMPKADTTLLRNILPDISLINSDWVSLDPEYLVTSRPAFKQMLDIVAG